MKRTLLLAFLVILVWHGSPITLFSQDNLINGNLLAIPNLEVPSVYIEESIPGEQLAPIAAPLHESPVNASFLGRAAVVGDSTRLAGFAGSGFIPAAIPVEGQAFFDSGFRANVQGSGSAVGLKAVGEVLPGVTAGSFAQILVNNADILSDGSQSANLTVQQAFGRLNRLRVGLMDSAFSDPSAVPDTLDVAGPNARVTVYPAGLGAGQGRLSYDFFSPDPDGFKTTVSIEQPRPQIATTSTTGTFAKYPDLIVASQYVAGDHTKDNLGNDRFYERWHLQCGTLFRNVGLEDSTGDFQEDTFAYGVALSGAIRFVTDPCLEPLDRLTFSVTYGEGISRYITDLNAAPDTGDAVVDFNGDLTVLPVLAWYVGYTHNWTNCVRSTVAYSEVNLDSVTPLVSPVSPYHEGRYVAVNLVYHAGFLMNAAGGKKNHNFFTGIEYLAGQKETLDGIQGDAHRLMWLVAISN